jgi:hypothetical protein
MIVALNPVQKYLLRVVLFDAGKTIQHKNRICEVVETCEHLRRLLPLFRRVDEKFVEGAPEPFWVPLRPAHRKQFNLERMWRSRRHRTLPPPVWTGEARPKRPRAKLSSNYPSTAYLARLVSELGYNGHAAFAASVRGHLPWLQLIDRRKTCVKSETSSGHPEHPYIPVAPNQRTTRGGGYRKEQVTAAIAKHRWDEKHNTAVFEIVYLRRKPFLVAASLGLKLTTVYQYSSRVRADLRKEQATTPRVQHEELDLLAENSNSSVFSECV